MITYKINVLEALKKKGFSTYQLRKDKLIGESAITKLRESEIVGIKTIDTLCRLLNCGVADILEYRAE